MIDFLSFIRAKHSESARSVYKNPVIAEGNVLLPNETTTRKLFPNMVNASELRANLHLRISRLDWQQKLLRAREVPLKKT